MNAQKTDQAIMAKLSELVTDLQAGDVVRVAGTGLFPLLLVEWFEDGMWEGKDGSRPMWVALPLVTLDSFTTHHREVGLPGCHFVRDHEWQEKIIDELPEEEAGWVVLDCTLYVLEPMLDRVEKVGRVTEDALDAAEEKQAAAVGYERLSSQDLENRAIWYSYFKAEFQRALHPRN